MMWGLISWIASSAGSFDWHVCGEGGEETKGLQGRLGREDTEGTGGLTCTHAGFLMAKEVLLCNSSWLNDSIILFTSSFNCSSLDSDWVKWLVGLCQCAMKC